MITISLCMIVKNEEKVLARCLDSAADLADEIIIADTGSTDKTAEIARRYTDKVYSFAWIDDFAAARNFSFDKATMQYCMWLDADDVLEDDARERLRELKLTLSPSTDVVMMKYHTAFDKDGTPLFSYYRERLLKNCPAYRWAGAVHEAITPCGEVVYSDIAVSHKKIGSGDPDRNLRIFEKLLKEGQTLGPREQFYYARELYYHKRYQDAEQAFETFLAMPNGWVENQIEACRFRAFCHMETGQDEKALDALLSSLKYDAPRAEICCDIGLHFMKKQMYRAAIFWYETALSRERNDANGGFVLPDCYGFIPCMQLCVCYDRLNNPKQAEQYNEMAGRIKPESPEYLYNKQYFKQKADLTQ